MLPLLGRVTATVLLTVSTISVPLSVAQDIV